MKYLKMVALATVLVGGINGAALAQQEGLVNVNVGDVTALNDIGILNGSSVQIPVGIAAQVCGVDANVISQQGQGAVANCVVNQDQSNEAFINYVKTNSGAATSGGSGGGNGAGNGNQNGLVNVNVGNVTALNDIGVANGSSVQVPVGIAAQVCGVDANVITKQGQGALANCTVGQDQANESFINYVKNNR